MALPTRSEVYERMSDLNRQMIDCAAMMAHLHNTEGSDKDKKMAIGWLTMSEMYKAIQHKIILLGQGRLN